MNSSRHTATYQKLIMLPGPTNDEVTEKLFNKDETKVINVPLLDRNALSATEVRRRLELDEKWETLVIPTVVNYLKEIKAVKRIKSIT